MPENTLELYDLDGTMNRIDVLAALEGQSNDEVQHYIVAAAEYVAEKVGLSTDEVFVGIKTAMLVEVFPNRAKFENWASFPAADKTPVKVTPAVDHFLLMARAVEVFLQNRLSQEGDKENELTRKIKDFLAQSWGYPLFAHASEVALPHSHLSEDACSVIEDRLRAQALAVIFTNSSTSKAVALLKKAGFGDRISVGAVERGKIGAIGGAAKFQVDTSLPPDEIDLAEFYGPGAVLDLRRRLFREGVDNLMQATGANRVAMFTDVPELDSYPLNRWYGDRAIHGMKTNPVSAPEGIAAARQLLRAAISDDLSELVLAL